MIPAFFSPVADHLWQSTVFVLAAALLALTLRKNQARTRHWIWMAASIKFLIPLALLINVGHRFDWLMSRPASVDSSISTFFVQQAAQPFTWNQTIAVPSEAAGTASGASGNTLPAWVIVLWLSGCLTLLLRWRRNWRRVRSVLRHGHLLTEGREVETLQRLQ
jgi:bla regulator protein blaR1